MKNIKFLISMVTAITLISIDAQASGPDGLINYGDLMRGLVWLLIAFNVAACYEFVRAAARGEA